MQIFSSNGEISRIKMTNTFGNTKAANMLDDMLENKYPDKISTISRMMYKCNRRFSNIKKLTYDREYISNLIMQDFTSYLKQSKLPTELKSFMRNLMVAKYRQTCNYKK